jgi:hypothetical protein
MNSDSQKADDILLQKKQMIDILDKTIDQKKMLFKQLICQIEALSFEIYQLEDESKNINSASVEKSLIDCLY